MAYYGIQGGSGGGVTNNQYASFFSKTGPSSYTTGGFVIDLSATYSSLNNVVLIVKKGSRGTLPAGRLEYLPNTPDPGKVTVKVRKYQFDQVSSIGNVQNQPSGVTVQGSSGVATSSEAAHTHSMAHDHAAQASTATTTTGAGVNSSLITLGQNVTTHTHSVDVPNFTGNTGAGSSHNHVDNNLYAHSHTDTLTDTNLAASEVANATDLSSVTWLGMATGVRA